MDGDAVRHPTVDDAYNHVTLVFRAIVAFKVFDEVYPADWGRPGNRDGGRQLRLYRRFFTEDRVGYGSAMSVAVIFLVCLLLVVALSARRRTEAAVMTKRTLASHPLAHPSGADRSAPHRAGAGRLDGRCRLPHADLAADGRRHLHADLEQFPGSPVFQDFGFPAQLPQFHHRRRAQHRALRVGCHPCRLLPQPHAAGGAGSFRSSSPGR